MSKIKASDNIGENKTVEFKKGDKFKHFWYYSVIMFVVATALIIVAAKLQKDSYNAIEVQYINTTQQLDNRNSMIFNIQQLNNSLVGENNILKDNLKAITDENDQNSDKIQMLTDDNANALKLLTAQADYISGNKAAFKADMLALAGITWPEKYQSIYDNLNAILNK